MKEKILAKLISKYSGLSKKFLGFLAEKMATKITEESGIDEAITALDNATIPITDLASEFQKEGDRRVTDAKKEWDKAHPTPATEETDDETDDEEEGQEGKKPKKKKKASDEPPAWAMKLEAKVDGLLKEKVQGTMKEKLKEKLKDVPEKFYANWQLPEKEEDIEAFVEKVNETYTEFAQNKTDQEADAMGKPIEGKAPVKVNTQAAVNDIKAWGAKKTADKAAMQAK